MRIGIFIYVLVGLVFVTTILLAQTKNQRNAANDLLREPGTTLHDAAKIAGGRYVATEGQMDGWVEYQNTGSMAQASDVVVAGVATDNVCKLSAEKKSIETIYQFIVDQSLKGEFNPGQMMVVSMPGGRVSFKDGTVAEINTPRFRRMVNGNRYLLFLTKRPDGTYFPTGRSQGVFELRANDKVVPYNQTSALSKYRGQKILDFLDEVTKAVRNDKADNETK